MRLYLALLLGFGVASCGGGTPPPAEPEPAEPEPAAEPTTADEPVAPPPAGEAAEPPEKPADEPDAGPPPLRAGIGTAIDGGTAAEAAPCNTQALRSRLESIVAACRQPKGELCGSVSVSRGDGGVAADFELSTTTGVQPFAGCVSQRVARVPWECLKAGDEVRIDLGCEL